MVIKLKLAFRYVIIHPLYYSPRSQKSIRSFMATIIIFLLILSLLVIVHEAGHFVLAKKFGMKVYEFGLGFPPRAGGFYRDPKTGRWKWVSGFGKREKRKEKGGFDQLKETVGGGERVEEFPGTLYSLNWLPIGGFVKIKGESGEKANESDSFAHKKPWQRLIVLVAGVFMNVVLAAILLSIGFMIGLPTDVTEGIPKGATLTEPPAVVVQQVVAESPARAAGIRLGDKIISLNSEAVETAKDLTEKVREQGAVELTLIIKRGDEELALKLTPAVLPEDTDLVPRLGILLADAGIVRYPWYRALYQGAVAAGFSLINIFVAFYILIKNLILGQGLAFEVSGPVGIASIVGASARLGFNYLLNVTAMISLSLAAINILPIPALDGGRALFVVIEKIIRRPVALKYEQLAHTIGFVLLMILIVIVTARDILGLVR